MTLKGQCSDASKLGLQAPGGDEQRLPDGSGHSQCQSGGKRRMLGQEVAWKAGLKLPSSSLWVPLWGLGPWG